MLLFVLNLDSGSAPPVESTAGAVLILTSPVIVSGLTSIWSMPAMAAPVLVDRLEASVALIQLEGQL